VCVSLRSGPSSDRLADRLEITDPEGTNLSSDLTEDMSDRWARGVYQQGISTCSLIKQREDFLFRRRISGVPEKMECALADAKAQRSHRRHGKSRGHFRDEVQIKDGFVADVKGTGCTPRPGASF